MSTSQTIKTTLLIVRKQIMMIMVNENVSLCGWLKEKRFT